MQLDGTLAGDVGFDPLGLSEINDVGLDLYWFAEAELKHCRLVRAMRMIMMMMMVMVMMMILVVGEVTARDRRREGVGGDTTDRGRRGGKGVGGDDEDEDDAGG
jgi:hypothetical protein